MNISNAFNVTSIDSKAPPLPEDITIVTIPSHPDISMTKTQPNNSIAPMGPINEIEALLAASMKSSRIAGPSPENVAARLLELGVPKYLDYLNNPRLLNSGNAVLDFGGSLPNASQEGDKMSRPLSAPPSAATRLVVEYGECWPGFARVASDGKDVYDGSRLGDNGITREDFEATVGSAQKMLFPLRGSVARSNFFLLLGSTLGLAVVLLAGILAGCFVTYFITLALVGTYMAALVGYVVWQKQRSSQLLFYSHIALALFVRSENNRLYLSHKVLLRPGHLGKWLEFHMLPSRVPNCI